MLLIVPYICDTLAERVLQCRFLNNDLVYYRTVFKHVFHVYVSEAKTIL